MKPLYTEIEFNLAKSNTTLPCQCYFCMSTFYTKKSVIKNIKSTSSNQKYLNIIINIINDTLPQYVK